LGAASIVEQLCPLGSGLAKLLFHSLEQLLALISQCDFGNDCRFMHISQMAIIVRALLIMLSTLIKPLTLKEKKMKLAKGPQKKTMCFKRSNI